MKRSEKREKAKVEERAERSEKREKAKWVSLTLHSSLLFSLSSLFTPHSTYLTPRFSLRPMPVPTIAWEDDTLRLIDQTVLPERYVRIDCGDVETVAEAIESLRVRGAPAIGVAAAYGVVIGAREALASRSDIVSGTRNAIERLARTRPTAVNLFWALDRMSRRLSEVADRHPIQIRDRLLEEAQEIF